MLHLFHNEGCWKVTTVHAGEQAALTIGAETTCRWRGVIYNGRPQLQFRGIMMGRAASLVLAVVCASALGGCEFVRNDLNKTFGRGNANVARNADLAAAQVTTIGVNSYLWRAALDTLSFAPLAQVDSAGGVIVTDWYANPAAPSDRVKVTVTILDSNLRADALRVAASRQVLQGGQWVEAPVAAATVQRLEEIILTKARDLRRSAIAG
jgi:hypothetical protein